MKVSILDGYIDEPSRLGVPPYIAPEVRALVGAVLEAECKYEYLTIDDWRNGRRPTGNLLVVVHGALVPGRYLLTYPASSRELIEIARQFRGKKIFCGPSARFHYFQEVEKYYDYVCRGYAPQEIYNLLTDTQSSNHIKIPELNRFLFRGAEVVKTLSDFPDGVIAEIETSFGCPRYLSGGCSFCTEPLYGKVLFRDEEDIIREISKLREYGTKFFRIGGQSCILSYKAYGIGHKEIVEPNVDAISTLFEGISRIKGIEVLHLDNANPAVISNFEEKSRKIIEIFVKYCTPGNVLALGMESADPKVIKENNLNATPDEVMRSIEIINEIGSEYGENGMPKLLPGLNFIGGLDGETKMTYSLNKRFLTEVENRRLLLRRINVRKVASIRKKFKLKYPREFSQFRLFVRELEKRMLMRIAPRGHVLRGVRTEIWKGTATYARQPGTYPIVVVIPDRIALKQFIDVKVYAHSERSLRALPYPIDLNNSSYKLIRKIPGIESYLHKILKDRSTVEKISESIPESIREWIKFK